MLIPGEMVKEGAYYSAIMIDSIGAYGEGRSRRTACDALVEMVHAVASSHRSLDGFKASVVDTGETTIYLSANDPARLLSLLLRHQRTACHLSLADVAVATGAKSRNGYAQYEQGTTEPSIAKLQQLLDVVAPGFALAVIPRASQVLSPHIDHGDRRELDTLLKNPTPANAAAFRDRSAKRRMATK